MFAPASATSTTAGSPSTGAPLPTYLAAQQAHTQQVLLDSTGSSSLQLQHASVATVKHPSDGTTHVEVTGSTHIHNCSVDVHGKLAHKQGVLHLVLEAYPRAGQKYDLHTMSGAPKSVALPPLTGQTAFVVSNVATKHTMLSPSAPRATTTVQPGLNVVSATPVSEAANPQIVTLFATSAPSDGSSSRRLSGSVGPPPANSITTLEDEVERWFHNMTVSLEGLIRPYINASSVDLPSLSFNDNVELKNTIIRLPSHSNEDMSFQSTAVVTLPGQTAPASFSVGGSLTASNYKFAGALENWQLGAADSGLAVHDAALQISGGRGGVPAGSAVTTRVSLGGSASISGVNATFAIQLPVSKGGFSVDLADVHLDHRVTITEFKLTLQDTSPHFAASGTITVDAGLEDDAGASKPLQVSASLTFGEGFYFVSGGVENWHLAGIGENGLTLNDVSLTISGPTTRSTAPTGPDTQFIASILAKCSFGGVTMDAKVNIPALHSTTALVPAAPPAPAPSGTASAASKSLLKTRGLTIVLGLADDKAQLRVQDVLEATAGSGSTTTALSHLPAASSVLSHAKGAHIESVQVAITTQPMSVVAKGTVALFGADQLNLEVVLQRVSCKWEFAFGVALTSPFKFSDVVPSDTSFDFLPFATGIVVVSTSNATFSMSSFAPLPAESGSDSGSDPAAAASVVGAPAPLSLSVKDGVALSAQLPFKQLSERLVSDGTWSHVEYASVFASFGFSTHDMVLKATLPPNLPLGKDVNLTHGSIDIQSSAPQFSLDASAAVTYAADEAPLECSLTGTLGDGGYDVTGRVADWHIGAESKGVEIKDASLHLVGKRTTTGSAPHETTHVDVTGSVSGDVSFGSMELEAVIELPVTKDHVEVEVPLLKLCKDVTLSKVTLDISGADDYTFAGTANLDFSADNKLELAVTGAVNGDHVSFTGTLSTWKLGGFSARDVALSLAGTKPVSHTGSLSLTGSLSGTLDFWGTDVSFQVALPLDKDGEIRATVSDLSFAGGHVLLKSVSLLIQDAEPKYTISADATVETGLQSHALDLHLAGTFDEDAFNVTGTLANWGIANDFTIAKLAVNLVGTRPASGTGGTHLTGKLSGEMTFDSVTVDVEAVLPASSLTVTFPLLRLTPEVVLKDVSLTVRTAEPHFEFTGTAQVTTHLPSSPFELTVSGWISGSTFSVTGTIPSWHLEVGHEGITATDVALTVSGGVNKGDLTGSLTGTVAFASADFDITVDLPGPTKGEGLLVKLDLKSSSTITLEHLASSSCGATAVANAKAPSGLVDKVKDAAISQVEVVLVTKPASINVTGSVAVPSLGGDLEMKFSAADGASSGGSGWSFAFGLAIVKPFKFSDVDPGNTELDFIPFSSGGLVISTFAKSPFAMPSSLGTLDATDGVTMRGGIAMTHLSEKLEASGKWTNIESLAVTGTFGLASHALALKGTLPPNLPMGKHVTVNATVTIQGAVPQYDLDATAAVVLGHQMPPVMLDADIAVQKSGEFTLTGTGHDYTFHVGHKGLNAKTVSLSMTDGGSATFTGKLTGVIDFSSGIVLDFELDIPTPQIDAGITLDLTLAPEQQVTMGQVIDFTTDMGDGSSLGVPNDFDGVIHNQLLSGSLALQSVPPKFTARGTMSLFHFDHPLELELVVQKGAGSHPWDFGIGIGIGEAFNFGQVMPSHSSASLNKFHFTSGGIALATSKSEFDFKLNQVQTMKVIDGIAIQADLGLAQGHLSTVSKWSKADALVVIASFEFAAKEFKFEVDLDTDWHIGKHLAVSDADFFMEIGGPEHFAIGLGVHLAATVGHKHAQTLLFSASIMFTLDSLKFDARMSTPWHEPFGLHGVTIGDTEIMLGISFAGVPDAFGFSGSLTIGSETGSATVYVDAGNPSSTVVAGSLTYFNLGSMLEHLTDNLMPSFLAKTVFDVGFTGLSLEANMGTNTLFFNGQYFEPGFKFSVKSFVMYGITGSAAIAIGERSFYLNAKINPLHVGPNGDILSISGYDCSSCPAKMLIAFGGGHTPGGISISASASVLDIIKADANIQINDKEFVVDVYYTDGLFALTFKLTAPGLRHPTDFSLYASVEDKLLSYIGTNVVGYMKEAKEAADSKLTDARKKVEDWRAKEQPKINSNDAEISRIEEEDKAKFDGAEAKLRSAEGSLAEKKKHVESLQGEIDNDEHDKRHCHHWYDAGCHAHNGWEDTKIAALWVAMHAAEAALDIAEGAVRAAGGVVKGTSDVVSHVDPRVLALRTENGALEAAGKVAEAALSAAEGVTNAVLDTVDFALEAVADIFNIEEIWFSAGSLSGVKHGDQVSMGVRGILVGKHFDWELKVTFPMKVEHAMKSIWEQVKHDIHL